VKAKCNNSTANVKNISKEMSSHAHGDSCNRELKRLMRKCVNRNKAAEEEN